MDTRRALARTVLGCITCAVAPLYAAQPYVTDDARLIPAGACQLEVGKRVLRDGREAWFLPACNAFANIEMTLGTNRVNPDDTDHATDVVLQGKGLFREMKPGDYGLGWVANLEVHRHPQPGQTRVGNVYAAGIYSHSFLDDTFFIHANLGVRRLRDTSATAVAWGVAVEYNFTDRVAILAETADTTRSRRGYQMGLWFSLVPDHVELDISIGGEARDFRQTRFWTVGVRFITPPLLK